MTARIKLYRIRPQALVIIIILLLAASGIWVSDKGLDPVQIASRPPLNHHILPVLPPDMNETPVDCSSVACIALSFDDGPHPEFTSRVLDILSSHQVRASFFLIGAHVAQHPTLVQRVYLEGHEVGNHSWSHPNFTKISPAEIESQVAQTQQAIMATGVPAPHLFRPPYGAVNDMVRAHVPLALAMWNIDPEDWHEKNPVKIVEHIEVHAKPGAIIDMHDTNQQTVDALGPVIEKLKGRYQFVTVSQLFDIPPGQRGEFYGRQE